MLALKRQLNKRAVFLILMVLGVAVLAAAAPAMGWSSVVSVASDVPSWYPHLAVDDADTVHLVYRDGFGAGTLRIKYQRSTDGGATWGSVTTLSTVDNDKDAVVVCDGDTVLVIWTDGTSSLKLRAIRSTDGGSTWGTAYDLLSQASWLRFPQVVVDSKHNFHMIYSHNNDIYYRMSPTGTSGSWSNDSTVMTTYLYRPGLSIDSNDVIYATARNNFPDQISIARLSTLGGNWSSEISVAVTIDNDNYVSFPRTASSVGGETVYIVFENGTKACNSSSDSGNPIYFDYSTDNGTTWAGSVQIGSGFCPQICVDDQDSISVLWYQNNGTTEFYGQPQGNIIYRSAPGPTHVFGDTVQLNVNPALVPSTSIPDFDPPKGVPNLVYNDSTLYAAWTDASTDNNRVFVRTCDVGSAGASIADSLTILRQDRLILPADGVSTTEITISVGIGAGGLAGETIYARLLQGGGSLSSPTIISDGSGTATLTYTAGATDDTLAVILFSDTCNGADLGETAYVSLGMIENFENGLSVNGSFLSFGTANEGIALDALVTHTGNYSLGDTANFSGDVSWGVGWQKIFSDSVDLSDFLTVSFWLRSDATVDTPLVKIEFITGETPSTWSMIDSAPMTTTFTEITKSLTSTDFERTAGSGSFDTTYVTKVDLLFYRGEMEYTRSFYVDDITLGTTALADSLTIAALPHSVYPGETVLLQGRVTGSGAAISGDTITFSILSGNGSLAGSGQGVTTGDGIAGISFTAPSDPGVTVIQAADSQGSLVDTVTVYTGIFEDFEDLPYSYNAGTGAASAIVASDSGFSAVSGVRVFELASLGGDPYNFAYRPDTFPAVDFSNANVLTFWLKGYGGATIDGVTIELWEGFENGGEGEHWAIGSSSFNIQNASLNDGGWHQYRAVLQEGDGWTNGFSRASGSGDNSFDTQDIVGWSIVVHTPQDGSKTTTGGSFFIDRIAYSYEAPVSPSLPTFDNIEDSSITWTIAAVGGSFAQTSDSVVYSGASALQMHYAFDSAPASGVNSYSVGAYREGLNHDVSTYDQIVFNVYGNGAGDTFSFELIEGIGADTENWGINTFQLDYTGWDTVVVPMVQGLGAFIDQTTGGNDVFDSDALAGYFSAVSGITASTWKAPYYLDNIRVEQQGSVIDDFEHVNAPYLVNDQDTLYTGTTFVVATDSSTAAPGSSRSLALDYKMGLVLESYGYFLRAFPERNLVDSGGLSLWMFAADTYADNYQIAVDAGGKTYQSPKRAVVTTGMWHHVFFPFSSLTNVGTPLSTSADIQKVTGVTITFYGDTDVGSTRNVWIDQLALGDTIDHFIITLPETTTAGAPTQLTVTAVDADSNPVLDYDYEPVVSDSGGAFTDLHLGRFTSGVCGESLTFNAAGTTTVTITDPFLGISTISATIYVEPAALNGFSVSSPLHVDNGVAFTLDVNALDFYDNILTTYTGDVVLSDSSATISPTWTGPFVSGVKSESVTISSFGRTMITASDTIDAKSGSGTEILVTSADSFIFTLPASVYASQAFTLTITALDPDSATAADFTDTVHLSVDTGSISPALVGPFTAGARSESVTIDANSGTVVLTGSAFGISGTVAIYIQPGVADHFNIIVPSQVVATDPFNITVRALDASNNVVPVFSGTATLQVNPSGTLDTSVVGPFVNGVFSGSVTLTGIAGLKELYVSTGTIEGFSDSFTLTSGGKDQISWLDSQMQADFISGSYDARFVDSYKGDNFERAYLYDQALAVIAYTRSDDYDSAQLILNALACRQDTSGAYSDYKGSWRNAFVSNTGEPAGDAAYVGANLWVIMAINTYTDRSGDNQYVAMAEECAEWVLERFDASPGDATYGSVTGGINTSGVEVTWRSTEHACDFYSAFFTLARLDGISSHSPLFYDGRAQLLKNYVFREMWQNGTGYFYRGYGDAGKTLDTQSWGVLSFGLTGPDGQDLRRGLDFNKANMVTTQSLPDNSDSVTGFDFEDKATQTTVWSEGTEGMVAAYLSSNRGADATDAEYYHEEIRAKMLQADGGVIYSTTGDVNSDTHESIAGSTWFYFNEVLPSFNPYENTYPGSETTTFDDFEDVSAMFSEYVSTGFSFDTDAVNNSVGSPTGSNSLQITYDEGSSWGGQVRKPEMLTDVTLPDTAEALEFWVRIPSGQDPNTLEVALYESPDTGDGEIWKQNVATRIRQTGTEWVRVSVPLAVGNGSFARVSAVDGGIEGDNQMTMVFRGYRFTIGANGSDVNQTFYVDNLRAVDNGDSVDDFEQLNTPFQTGAAMQLNTTTTDTSPYALYGMRCLEAGYTSTTGSWWSKTIRSDSWSGYTGLTFSHKASAATTNQLQLSVTAGGVAYTGSVIDLDTSWDTVFVPFATLQNGGSRLTGATLESVTGYTLTITGSDGGGTVYVDNVTLSTQSVLNSLSVTITGADTGVDFDTFTGSPDPVAASETIVITFATLGIADGTQWKVRLWSAHPGISDSDVAKLVGVTDSSYAVPIKAWCNNLGPGGNCPPDPAVGSTFDTGYFYFSDFGDTVSSPGWNDGALTLITDSVIYGSTTIYAGLGSLLYPGLPAQKYEAYLVIDLVSQ